MTDDMKNPEHYPVALSTRPDFLGDIVAVVAADRATWLARRDRAQSSSSTTPSTRSSTSTTRSADRVVIHEALGTNKSYTWALSPPRTPSTGPSPMPPTR